MKLSLYIAQKLSGRSSTKSFTHQIINLAKFSIALGFAAIVISFATVNGFQREIKNKITGFAGDIEIRQTGATANHDYPLFDLDSQLINQIQSLPGVNFVNVAANKPAIIKHHDEILGIVCKGIPPNYKGQFLNQNIIYGRTPLGPGEIMVSDYMARVLEIDTGQKTRLYFIKDPIRAIPVKVTGIYSTGIEDHDKLFAIGNITDLQRIFANRQNQITHIEVTLNPNIPSNQVQQLLFDMLDYNLDPSTAEDIHIQIYQWIEYLNVNKLIILSLMVFVCGICLITALLILVIERTNMIGILKTLGASNSLIKQIFLIKLARITLSGMFLGNLLGLGLIFFQDYTGFFKLNKETYYLSTVPVEIDPLTILAVNAGCFVLCLLALILPVQIVSSITPAKTVKFN